MDKKGILHYALKFRFLLFNLWNSFGLLINEIITQITNQTNQSINWLVRFGLPNLIRSVQFLVLLTFGLFWFDWFSRSNRLNAHP